MDDFDAINAEMGAASSRWNADSFFGNVDLPVESDPARPEPAKRELRFFSGSELGKRILTVEYIVAGLLAKGQPFVLAGKTKTLKSTIMLELAVCIVTGKPFLGSWIDEPQPVVMLSGESGLPTLKDKLRASLLAKDLDWTDVGNLILSDEIINITSMRDIDAIERLMDESNAKVLFIDPAYLSMPGDQMSNVFGMGEMLRTFAGWCVSNGVTWGLCHHAKKTIVHNEPLERHDIAGAGFDEFVRQWMLLNHRQAPDMDKGDFRLWLTWGGSAGHSGGVGIDIHEGIFSPTIPTWREWNCSTIPMKECRQALNDQQQTRAAKKRQAVSEAKVAEYRPKLIKTLNDGPKTRNEISARLGKSISVWDALDELIEENLVQETTVQRGNNSKDYPAFELPTNDSAEPADPPVEDSAEPEG